jgi:predicted histone-like DNA-binding protein
MAYYEMREMPDLHGTGETIIYPRMVVERHISSDQWAQLIAAGTTFSAGEVKGIIAQMAQELARCMGDGCSVKIDGIGTFSAKLQLNPDVEREQPNDVAMRNARSIHVSGVRYQADTQLMRQTNKTCILQRNPIPAQRSSEQYTPQQRLDLALDYLQTTPYITVRDYARITGLRNSTAAAELRLLVRQETSPLQASGRPPHRTYIKRETSQ